MKSLVLILSLLIYCSRSEFSVSQIGHIEYDAGTGIDKDSRGTIYISGYTSVAIYGTWFGNYDVYMEKYFENGTLIKGAQFGSSGYEISKGQTLSPDESTVYVTGFTTASWFSGLFGTECGFVLAVNSADLTQQWGTQICGTGGITEFSDVAIPPNDPSILYACGFTNASYAENGYQASATNTAMLVQISTESGTVNWKRLQNGYVGQFYNIEIDITGAAWVAGYMSGSDVDCLVAKWNVNGTLKDQKQFGTPSLEVCFGIVVDEEQGGVYVSGSSYATLDSSGQLLNTSGYYQPFVTYLDAQLNMKWLTQLNSTPGNTLFTKLSRDSEFNLYAAGWSDAGSFDGNSNHGAQDIAVAFFRPNGDKISSRLLGTSQMDRVSDLVVDSHWTMWVLGTTNATWTESIQPPLDTVLIKGVHLFEPAEKSKKKDNTVLIAGVAAAGGVLVIAGISAAVFIAVKKSRKEQKTEEEEQDKIKAIESKTSDISIEIPSPTVQGRNQVWEIDYRKLERGKELGRGAFGVVYLATWRNSSVAVKQLDVTNTNAQTTANFLKEAQNVRNLRPHPNICAILGVCTDPDFPICIVMEYIPFGSLSDLLIEKKILLDPILILQFAKDIASGMSHLHAESILHCDLACRNLLVSAHGNEFQLRVWSCIEINSLEQISDFGLSRMIEAQEYVSTTHNFPVRWSAPETLKMGKLSRASDVWSYGITLWEMIEERMPYPNLTNAQVLEELEKGHRPPPPTKQQLPDSFYELMLRCWQETPSQRPSFEAICSELPMIENQLLKKNTEVQIENTTNTNNTTHQNFYTTEKTSEETYNNDNNNN